MAGLKGSFLKTLFHP